MFKPIANTHKSKAHKHGLHDRKALEDKTNSILNKLNKEYKINYKTTFTKEVKKMLDISEPKKIACQIKENIESRMEETCFER